ncbi:DNA-binding transcriptional regulator, MerR family [Caminicella sporogenes DSM 14501]|uniref:DNA-binding transcriptional regulator, MerR family n=1 Tax=Caminicella sporogenes DSM 14501 TaxID=1121266 RepID=A0A1M6LTC5_9FIRM|nr:helix-turn-helix domain-containing protein [Caminicella sporogenes]RKD27945.1 hypothetical protein BET04_02480 [Caminicella sporogenes]SHJ74467.1 DNA-binding transcriptional regulator, MerR family [Caminicella sporogenes DSM 14501]
MYTIGEFALIAEVSTKTLRYYDNIGLFKPFKIDNLNSYRYYSKEQISEIMFIKELKKYGLSLTDISEIKKSNSKEFLNNILERQLSIIDKKIAYLEDMKISIKKKINEPVLWIENNDKSDYFIDIIKMKASEVIFVREKIKSEEIGQLIGKLYEIVNKFSVKFKSNHMVIIHNRDENENVDVEVFIPIEKTKLINKIYIKRFEGGIFLKTTHNGVKNKWNAYAKLYDFAKQKNYKLIGPAIEKYEMKLGKFIIDIMFKVEQ